MSTPDFWFVRIDDNTSYIAMDVYDAIIRVMCHHLRVDYSSHMYSYVQLRELMCVSFGIPFSFKKTPYTMLEYMQQHMGVVLTSQIPLNNQTRYGQKSKDIVAYRIGDDKKTYYSNSYIDLLDAIKLRLFPHANPTDTTLLLTLSALSGVSLLHKDRLQVVDTLIESGYLHIIKEE